MSRFVVGLTGGIGSGKSTVGCQFAQLGIVVVDADQAARAVVQRGSEALAAIAGKFGKQLLTPDRELDRKALREIVFADSTALKWLESLTHPLIREWITGQLSAATSPYAILETPLLFETNQHQLVDRALVVDVPVELQRERASQRDDQTPAQIDAIIAKQMPRQERLARADDVIENSGGVDSLTAQVQRLHVHYLQLAADANDQTR